MAVELRWVVPDGTPTERPRLQYRQCGPWPAAWGEWQDVPTVAVPQEPPKPAPTVAHVFGVRVPAASQPGDEAPDVNQWSLPG